jgi:hypothetical protein
MQNCKLREEQRTKEQYEKLCERFREELVDMQKRDPIELKDKAEQRTFYCEVKQFNDSKAKDEYLNNPNLLHKGGTPDKKIMNAFTLSKKNGMTTLRIRI